MLSIDTYSIAFFAQISQRSGLLPARSLFHSPNTNKPWSSLGRMMLATLGNLANGATISVVLRAVSLKKGATYLLAVL